MAANPSKTPFWAGRTGRTAVAVAVFAAFFVYVFVEEGAIALALIAGAVAVVGVAKLARWRAGRAIGREVQGEAIVAAPAPPAAAAPAPVAEKPHDARLPIAVDVAPVSSMPAVSAESRARFEAIHSRGARLRSLYRRAVFLLALATGALTYLASRISPDAGLYPWAIPLLLVATLVFLVYDAGRWGKVEREWPPEGEDARGIAVRVSRALTTAAVVVTSVLSNDRLRHLLSTARRARGGAAAERDRWEEDVVPLQPVLVPLVGAAWIAVSLVEAAAYIDPSGVVFAVPVVLYLVALRRGKARLERRYPVDAPLNLLTLRVFSSPSFDDFVLMTDGWRWLGPMQRLDGSDTAGSSLRDVVAYVRGNVEDVIVEDDAELAEALAAFRAGPDGQLRYPLNSMQCNDASWKQALQAMLDDADAVVMDLSGFNEQRRGCAYEIGKLVAEVPLGRFVLLVNEDTDVEYLRRVLQDAWASMPESSPNAAARDPVRLLEIPAEAEDVDRDRLVGALRDAASAARDAPAARVLPWARPGLPRLCAFL